MKLNWIRNCWRWKWKRNRYWVWIRVQFELDQLPSYARIVNRILCLRWVVILIVVKWRNWFSGLVDDCLRWSNAFSGEVIKGNRVFPNCLRNLVWGWIGTVCDETVNRKRRDQFWRASERCTKSDLQCTDVDSEGFGDGDGHFVFNQNKWKKMVTLQLNDEQRQQWSWGGNGMNSWNTWNTSKLNGIMTCVFDF